VEDFGTAADEVLREIDGILDRALEEESARLWLTSREDEEVSEFEEQLLSLGADVLIVETLSDLGARVDDLLGEAPRRFSPVIPSHAEEPAPMDGLFKASPSATPLGYRPRPSHRARSHGNAPARHRGTSSSHGLKRWVLTLVAASTAVLFVQQMFGPAITDGREDASSGSHANSIISSGGVVSINASDWEVVHALPGVSRSGYRTEVACTSPATLGLQIHTHLTVRFRVAPEPLIHGSRGFAAQAFRNGRPVTTAKPIRDSAVTLRVTANPGDEVELRIDWAGEVASSCTSPGAWLIGTASWSIR
jgi:hypothetical protein